MRIVSMLPSASEIVCLCGGESMLVGRSHEDDWPASIKSLPIVTASNTVFDSSAGVEDQVMHALDTGTGMYSVNSKTLQELQPTHIVTQDLCHVCAIDLKTVDRIASQISPKPELITLNPLNFQDVLADIPRVANALGLEEGGKQAMASLNARIAAARGHWTPQLIYMAGGNQPMFPGTDTKAAGPSIQFSHEACIASDPEIIVIAPCGLSLSEVKREADLIRAQDWFQTLCNKPGGVKMCIVDGSQMFNRPGPRLVDALEFLVGFFWDDESLIPAGFPWERYE
ncbi:helical backbone metal receptor [Rhizoclosmatium globosum]|uniref:Helical backbone metal receptor n=1 Tax=Rhizoclosmatium globosum TaxID=329046 RepID=A0A1Y2BYK4_9FUNG|nr:helical backbone metal receptor [Rhizoclosmatium globosum]|eukprot:ORY39145.1 helical backbone metal receptor [Rhizoclosmatium globosum]